MAVITLCSAGGAPGVSTTALAMAISWHRPALFVEADPAGASALAAGYYRGEYVPPNTIVDLGTSFVRGTLYEDLRQIVVPIPETDTQALFGTRSCDQARSLSTVWESLTQVFRALEKTGQDVIVDAGRLGLENSPEALIYGADLCLVMLRSDLRSVVAAKTWLEQLQQSFASRGVSDRLRLLLMGEHQPYSSKEVEAAIGVPVLLSIDDDPASAAVFSQGIPAPAKYTRSKLARSYSATVAATAAHVNQIRQRLGLEDNA